MGAGSSAIREMNLPILPGFSNGKSFMKSPHRAWLVAVLTAVMAACHHGPTAPSADGGLLKEGMVAYAKHPSVACRSKTDLHQSQEIAKQGDKQAALAYLNEHYLVFQDPDAVKILSIEPSVEPNDDQMVSVKVLSDSSVGTLWMASKSLLLNK